MTDVAMGRADRADREGAPTTAAVHLAQEGTSTTAPMHLTEEGT